MNNNVSLSMQKNYSTVSVASEKTFHHFHTLSLVSKILRMEDTSASDLLQALACREKVGCSHHLFT